MDCAKNERKTDRGLIFDNINYILIDRKGIAPVKVIATILFSLNFASLNSDSFPATLGKPRVWNELAKMPRNFGEGKNKNTPNSSFPRDSSASLGMTHLFFCHVELVETSRRNRIKNNGAT